MLEIAARESGVPIGDILENLPAELSVWVDPGEVSYRIGEKGAVKVNICWPWKWNFVLIDVVLRSYTPSRSTIHRTTTTQIVKWRRPLIPKLSALDRLKLLVHHWTDWRWALRAPPTTRRRLLRRARCTRTIAPRASIRVQQHSLDVSMSPYSSRPRPLHKRNSAAQNWRTTRNAPTGKRERNSKFMMRACDYMLCKRQSPSISKFPI